MKRTLFIILALLPALACVELLVAQVPHTDKYIVLTFEDNENGSNTISVTTESEDCWIDLNEDATCQENERIAKGNKLPIELPQATNKVTIYGPVTYLNANKTTLSNIDLSHTDQLRSLWCYNTQIEKIDVTGQPHLVELFCYYTGITQIDLSNNPLLESLGVQNCLLRKLDLTKLPLLKEVYLDGNAIGKLDLSQNPKLEMLACMRTKLTSLDLSHCPNLVFLECSLNDLTELNLAAQTKIETLKADVNKLTAIDVSTLANIKKLHLGGNQITEIDLSNNPLIEDLNLNNNKLTSLDFLSQLPALKKIAMKGNKFTSSPDFSHNPLLEHINVARCKFETLDLSHTPKVRNLFCELNNLKELSLPSIPHLQDLICHSNMISSLDFATCKELQYADMSLNAIDEEAMQTVVTTIPSFKRLGDQAHFGRLIVIDKDDPEEKNDITDLQVKVATDKHWEVMNSNFGDPQPYPGRTATTVIDQKDTNPFYYSPSEYRLYYHSFGDTTPRCIQIYTASGEEVLRDTFDEAASCSIYVGQLPYGVYVAHADGQVFKFIR